MKTKLELLGRTLLIYLFTILVGTFFSAIYMYIIDFERSADFLMYFTAGVLITGTLSIPTLFILFIGFFLIYRRCKNNTQKWQYVTLVWLLTCYIPVIIAIALLVESDTVGTQLFLASIPYVFTAFISIFSFTYFFDKRKPPVFQQGKEIMNDDDILDAPF